MRRPPDRNAVSDHERHHAEQRLPAGRRRAGGGRRVFESHCFALRRAVAARLPDHRHACRRGGSGRHQVRRLPAHLSRRLRRACRHPVRRRAAHALRAVPRYALSGAVARDRRRNHYRADRRRRRGCAAGGRPARWPARGRNRVLYRRGGGVLPDSRPRAAAQAPARGDPRDRIRHQRPGRRVPDRGGRRSLARERPGVRLADRDRSGA